MGELSDRSSHTTEIQALSFSALKEKVFAGLDCHLPSLFSQNKSYFILFGVSIVWIN